MAREITTHKTHGQDRQPVLAALGWPGPGGAEQEYEISYADSDGLDVIVPIVFISLESRGVTNEVLLAIVIDRLEGFQAGKLACPENATALACAKVALEQLQARTRDRMKRNVENKMEA